MAVAKVIQVQLPAPLLRSYQSSAMMIPSFAQRWSPAPTKQRRRYSQIGKRPMGLNGDLEKGIDYEVFKAWYKLAN